MIENLDPVAKQKNKKVSKIKSLIHLRGSEKMMEWGFVNPIPILCISIDIILNVCSVCVYRSEQMGGVII